MNTFTRGLTTLVAIVSVAFQAVPAEAAAMTSVISHPSAPSVSAGSVAADESQLANATSTLDISEDVNDPRERTIHVSPKKQTKNITMFVFDLKNEGQGSTALVNGVTLQVSTTTANGSPAVNINDIISKGVIMGGGRLYTGTVNANNTITFSFTKPVKISKNDTQAFTVVIDLLPQTNNYAEQGESLTFSIGSSGVTATDSKSGATESIAGSAFGYKQILIATTAATVEVNGDETSAVLTYNATDPSKSYGTFTVKFDITAVGDDVYIPRTIGLSGFGSTTHLGVLMDANMIASSTGTSTQSLTSTADTVNNFFYIVHAGDTETFTATVTIDPVATGDYQVGLDEFRFSLTDLDLNHLITYDVDQNDSQFHTDPLHIPNS